MKMVIGKTGSGNSYSKILLPAVVVLLALTVQGILLTGRIPTIAIEPVPKAIGKQTTFQVKVSESRRGLTSVKSEFIQGDASVILMDRSYSASSQFFPWGSKTVTDILDITAGTRNIPGLKEGPAVLRITVGRAPTWLRHPDPEILEISLPVQLTPPSLEVTSTHTYVSQGGCELVIYKVGETAERDGIRAGSWWFPGFPLPGGEQQERFALFSVPYDMATPDVRLIAVDNAGNEAERTFIDRFQKKSFRSDSINIDDSFISSVVSEILAHTPEIEDRGDPLENYLAVNRDLRQRNAETIRQLAQKSQHEFLWSGPFLMLPNGKVMATFGEKRTYRYKGDVIDQQTHLGYDFASIQRAPVPSPNGAIVVFAGYMGIYGNTVILDHGYGLMSISGHLSSIAVKEGQRVSRGETIGNTGNTGLAGGDHLHFSTLLQGLPVNPIEWSDGHWIQDRITRKIEEAEEN